MEQFMKQFIYCSSKNYSWISINDNGNACHAVTLKKFFFKTLSEFGNYFYDVNLLADIDNLNLFDMKILIETFGNVISHIQV